MEGALVGHCKLHTAIRHQFGTSFEFFYKCNPSFFLALKLSKNVKHTYVKKENVFKKCVPDIFKLRAQKNHVQDSSRAGKVLKKRLWETCVGETHSKMYDVLESNENLEVQRHNQVSLLESFVGSYEME